MGVGLANLSPSLPHRGTGMKSVERALLVSTAHTSLLLIGLAGSYISQGYTVEAYVYLIDGGGTYGEQQFVYICFRPGECGTEAERSRIQQVNSIPS